MRTGIFHIFAGLVFTVMLYPGRAGAAETGQAAAVDSADTAAAVFSAEDSLKHLYKTLRFHPDDVEAHRSAAMVWYLHQRDYGMALHHWREVIRLEPDNAIPHYYNAWIYYSRLHDNVRAEYEALNAIDKGFDAGARDKYWFKVCLWMLGQIYLEQGMQDVADALAAKWLAYYEIPTFKDLPKERVINEILRLRHKLELVKEEELEPGELKKPAVIATEKY